MQVSIQYLSNLKVQAHFDDFSVLTDQPIRYKGDGSAPSPFDYFLASSALCAGYFVKVYCQARDLPTEDIKIIQNNLIDPDNRYKQTFHIQVELPQEISEHHREGILKSIERCSVKRVIQNQPEFKIEIKDSLGVDTKSLYEVDETQNTVILGKDSPLEKSIIKLLSSISKIGINLEVASWRNPVPHVWSVHVRDADSPMCYTNGKGATKEAALCSALGEFIERISCNYFINDYYLGEEVSSNEFVFYPNEKWFSIESDETFPEGLMDEGLWETYDQEDLAPEHLLDANSSREKSICALPFVRQSDNEEVYIPVNLLGNLFVSNGMSAGNSFYEARVQALSEVFERAIKNRIIAEEIALPDIPESVLNKYPQVAEAIRKLEELGFAVLIKDASLGGRYPVLCVALLNPQNGGLFCSFGAHPIFEVALERSLTELLQGRSIEGLRDILKPTFNQMAVADHSNLVEHFVDSSGVISFQFLSQKSDFDFVEWGITGNTQDEFKYLMSLMRDEEKEVYIADYNCFNVNACRVIVPDFSEVYEKEDLVWENSNQARSFRFLILNLHHLDQDQLSELYAKLEEYEGDEFYRVYELIGVAFDDSTAWELLTIIELKAQLSLALNNFEQAKEEIELFFTYNECLEDRLRFYEAVSALIDIKISQNREIADFEPNLRKIFGERIYMAAINTIEGKEKFWGLEDLKGDVRQVHKHKKLLENYSKLQTFRHSSL